MIKKRVLAGLLVSIVGACASVSAQQGIQDPLLNHMTGIWVLQGTIMGQQTTHDITADWVLNHEYIQLHEISREKDAKGNPAYEATVFIGWGSKQNEYACLWLDTTSGEGLSNGLMGHGKISGSDLVLLFGSADGSTFHTTFSYDAPSDTWKWTMDGEEKGQLHPFARVTLKRK